MNKTNIFVYYHQYRMWKVFHFHTQVLESIVMQKGADFLLPFFNILLAKDLYVRLMELSSFDRDICVCLWIEDCFTWQKPLDLCLSTMCNQVTIKTKQFTIMHPDLKNNFYSRMLICVLANDFVDCSKCYHQNSI